MYTGAIQKVLKKFKNVAHFILCLTLNLLSPFQLHIRRTISPIDVVRYF
jgi:hypothetical protein